MKIISRREGFDGGCCCVDGDCLGKWGDFIVGDNSLHNTRVQVFLVIFYRQDKKGHETYSV